MGSPATAGCSKVDCSPLFAGTDSNAFSVLWMPGGEKNTIGPLTTRAKSPFSTTKVSLHSFYCLT